ncbi:type I restriction enzyme HsdR N-terminal domain-containing protein [Saccharicrinis fermentans]|uniref:Type I restriction enzyme R protein N-terminal domain-containing protein n=1 Tax=Saccharicrinis fermentans DSM 9555 = JCM 21142 TaxID=869213 RepID=W7Y1N3_9BACT|nr:type I restriction enzyme HsdR N-terminal domain-containing protein [Saccharicrinis fermentans]GAF01413.1 hypothetical protein JCM21142_19 [Saccharicrinis fermentans DSM 9555 = JCM 21142]
MQALNLPRYTFSLSHENGKRKIFDPIRKKRVALTPEEWVRQNFIMFLTQDKGYPASLIAVESLVNINGLSQRADIVVYNKQRQPVLVVECKAPSVKISREVFEQVSRYNIQLKTKLICVTNGLQHFCALLDKKGTGYNFYKRYLSIHL